MVKMIVMCHVRGGGKSAPVLCRLEDQGEPFKFETDTLSPYTIMANDTVKRIFGCCELDRYKVKVTSFTGHLVQMLGTVGVNVMFRDRPIKARIMVTEYKHHLLGRARDLNDKLGVLTVNLVKEAHSTIQ